MDGLDQGDRFPPFGDDDFLPLLGSAKVMGETVLEFPDPHCAHGPLHRSGYCSFFSREVKVTDKMVSDIDVRGGPGVRPTRTPSGYGNRSERPWQGGHGGGSQLWALPKLPIGPFYSGSR